MKDPVVPDALPGGRDDIPDADLLCSGRGTADGDHCCYVRGEVCRYLEVNKGPGREFVCSLRRDLGSWAAVHADPGYQEHVQSVWDEVGISSCGEWQPGPGQCCRQPR